jgi:hypothetical protein
MSNDNTSAQWERLWILNLGEKRAQHLPTGLTVEMRQTEKQIWYPFALNGEDWVAEDPARLEFFTSLMLQALTLYHERSGEMALLPHVVATRTAEA